MREFQLTGQWDTPKAPASVLRFTQPKVDQEAVCALASQLGFDLKRDRGEGRHEREKLVVEQGSHVFAIYRASGAFQYHDKQRWQVDDGRSVVQDVPARNPLGVPAPTSRRMSSMHVSRPRI